MKIVSTLCFKSIWILNSLCVTIAIPQAVILVNQGDRFDLVDLSRERESDLKSYKFIILACQADDKTQNELGKSSSTKHSLIIAKIVESPSNILDYEICTKKYSPSILQTENIYREKVIGYEFYLNNEQAERLSSVLPQMSTQFVSNGSYQNSLIRINKNWLFYFIMDVQPRFAGTTYFTTSKEYTGDFKNCIDFSLGRSFIENANIDALYVAENQRTALKNFLTKEQINGNYLIKQQLTSIEDFSSYSERLTTCTYLNIAPMWNSIAKGSWQIVENKIRQVTKTTLLEVSTGTYGTLRLPLLPSTGHKMTDLILYNTKIPELFWKFVVEEKPFKNRKNHYRGVLIFTFNYTEQRKLTPHFCKKSVCEKLEWKIDNHHFSSGYTYCCKPEKRYLKKLNLYDKNLTFSSFNL